MRRWTLALAAVGGLLLGASWLPWSGAVGVSDEPAAMPAIDGALVGRGRALFTVKGCIACHRHGDVTVRQNLDLAVGPDLTTYTAEPDYLRAWLADPAGIRPRTQMPNLGLSEGEIEVLVSFLTADPNAPP